MPEFLGYVIRTFKSISFYFFYFENSVFVLHCFVCLTQNALKSYFKNVNGQKKMLSRKWVDMNKGYASLLKDQLETQNAELKKQAEEPVISCVIYSLFTSHFDPTRYLTVGQIRFPSCLHLFSLFLIPLLFSTSSLSTIAALCFSTVECAKI